MKIILMLKTVELLGRNNQNFTKMLYSGVVQHTVVKNKLLTKVDAPKNRLAHENRCIKRASQL